jgi:hypothetical protein
MRSGLASIVLHCIWRGVRAFGLFECGMRWMCTMRRGMCINRRDADIALDLIDMKDICRNNGNV